LRSISGWKRGAMSKLFLCSVVLAVCVTNALADANDMPAVPVSGIPVGPSMVGDLAMLSPCTSGNQCAYYLGQDGFAASGSGNFNANVFGTAQLAYNFTTGLPLSWSDDGGSYYATFGLGGVFQMSLPGGLTFTGVVTSGSAGEEGLTSEVQVFFSGQWSNGQFATGNVYEYEIGNGPMESLTEQIGQGGQGRLARQSTPEPSTFLLLGSAALGALSWRNKLSRLKLAAVSQVITFQTHEKDVLAISRRSFPENLRLKSSIIERHFHALGIVYRPLESSTDLAILLLC
jgi:hypothetical protein